VSRIYGFAHGNSGNWDLAISWIPRKRPKHLEEKTERKFTSVFDMYHETKMLTGE
jgi:hypothetical protein